MPGFTKRLERLLQHAQQLIVNGQGNAEVADEMASYGYDAARWAEGQALLDTARQKIEANENAFAAQLGATDAFNAAFDLAWEQSQELARLCARLFDGQTELLELLGLHERRDPITGESVLAWPSENRRLSTFLAWGQNLYAVAQSHPAVAAMLANYGYPVERLSQEAAAVLAVVQANNAQEIAKARTQQTTVERDEAVAALEAWLARTKTVAKMALKGQRQLLEMLGLRTRRR
jgi:N-acetyl-anhydromuramyl-L-alanine amidase AmpD